MYDDKAALIYDEGVPFRVLRPGGDVETVALFGRLAQPSSNMFNTDTQRKAVFLPAVSVVGGDLVFNFYMDTYYLVISTFKEYAGTKHVSTQAILLKCNEVLSITTYARTADDNGNVRNTPSAPLSVMAHRIPVTERLKQADFGMRPDADYAMFIPATQGMSLEAQCRTEHERFKVVGIDTTSYEGIMVVQLASDIRK